MYTENRLEIPLKRQLLSRIGKLAVSGGIAVFTIYKGIHPEKGATPLNIALISLLALGVLFYGFIAVYFIWRTFDRSPALVLSREGLELNVGYFHHFFLPWQAVSGFSRQKYFTTEFLLVEVTSPDVWIEKMKYGLVRFLLRRNTVRFGTPFFFDFKTLDSPPEVLIAQLNTYHAASQSIPSF